MDIVRTIEEKQVFAGTEMTGLSRAENKADEKEALKRRTELAVEKYSQLVYGIVLTQLNCKCDVDDVYQEVFFTYFEKDMDFFGEEHEKAWLIRTAMNLCKRHNFSLWRMRTVPLSEAGAEDKAVFSTEEQTRVFAELRALKPKYKLPLYLHYFEDMSAEMIGEALGIRPETVRKQLQRGRELMKQRLECDYFE